MLPRFKHRGVRIQPRSLAFTSSNGFLMTVEAQPARWNKNDFQYSVGHNGYLVFNFLETDPETNKIDLTTKKTFIMTPKSIDLILDLEIQRPFDPHIDTEGEVVPYFSKNEGVMTILKVEKQKDRTFKFSYCEAGQAELREDSHGDQSVE